MLVSRYATFIDGELNPSNYRYFMIFQYSMRNLSCLQHDDHLGFRVWISGCFRSRRGPDYWHWSLRNYLHFSLEILPGIHDQRCKITWTSRSHEPQSNNSDNNLIDRQHHHRFGCLKHPCLMVVKPPVLVIEPPHHHYQPSSLLGKFHLPSKRPGSGRCPWRMW